MSSSTSKESALPEGYTLIESPPPPEPYVHLRENAGGLSPITPEQGAKAPRPFQDHAMGRIIGDGGWYFHLVDLAVLPAHQRKGLGGVILNNLLEKIVKEAPPHPYVNLIADPPGVDLYKKYGFVEAAGDDVKGGGVGMERRF
ncbi:hypothetical protein EJ08DRAFT_699909 [Tothia fuscella]|uniref:N-acetyltransferase domain-containing protein n=1 Tax=Tothia fuscella TaxID=1048955 RepID=A0A9P4NLP5_9PEZI|nr:hypothetical protein EJ08DRAFT_699909 [Tothia fuscella]